MMLAVSSVVMAGNARVWEEVDRMPAAVAVNTSDSINDDVAMTVADGYIYVSVRERINVKVFTILGQLVVQDTLAPGNYRFKLPSRGIFLLKAGGVTRRVTA